MFTTPRAPRLRTALVAARVSIRAYVSLASNALTDAGELLAAPLAMATKLAASVTLFHDGMDADASASTSSGVLHRVTARHIRLWSTNVRESSSPPARVLLNRLGAALSEVDVSEAGVGAAQQGGRERRPPPGLNPATIAEDVARLQAIQEAKQESVEEEERVLPPRRLCASALLSGGAAGCYVVSITGHKRLRRLHFVGACFRVPGIHFCEYEVLGSEAPSPDLYDAICKDCWNDEEEAGEAEDSADEVSSLPSEE